MIHNIAAWFINKQRPRTLRNLRLNSITTIEWLETRQLLTASSLTGSEAADYDISVAAVDVPLGLDLPGDPADAVLVRDNTPVQIDPGAVVEDVDTDVNYAGTKIHVAIVEGGVYADDKHNRVILSVLNEGSGAGLVEVKGSKVFFDGGTKAIAKFTGGRQGNQLAVTFTDDATIDAVNAVLAQLSITARRGASVGPRTISIAVTADGQTAQATQVANIYSGASVDESIKVTLPTDPAEAVRDGGPVQIDDTAAVEDSATGADYSRAQIRVSVLSGAGADDKANDRVILSVLDQGPGPDLVEVKGKRIFFDGGAQPIATFKGGHFGKPLSIFFKGGTLDAVNAVLKRLGIQATTGAAEGERRIAIEVTAKADVALSYTSAIVK